jgi:hypothetical protein
MSCRVSSNRDGGGGSLHIGAHQLAVSPRFVSLSELLSATPSLQATAAARNQEREAEAAAAGADAEMAQ